MYHERFYKLLIDSGLKLPHEEQNLSLEDAISYLFNAYGIEPSQREKHWNALMALGEHVAKHDAGSDLLIALCDFVDSKQMNVEFMLSIMETLRMGAHTHGAELFEPTNIRVDNSTSSKEFAFMVMDPDGWDKVSHVCCVFCMRNAPHACMHVPQIKENLCSEDVEEQLWGCACLFSLLPCVPHPSQSACDSLQTDEHPISILRSQWLGFMVGAVGYSTDNGYTKTVRAILKRDGNTPSSNSKRISETALGCSLLFNDDDCLSDSSINLYIQAISDKVGARFAGYCFAR